MKNFFIKFKSKIMIFLKGIIIGIAAIIPGVSGGSLAVVLNVYDEIIESISNIRKHFKQSMGLLIPLAIGAIVGLLALIYPLKWALANALLPTVCLFAGFIIGGIFPMFKKVDKNPKISGYISAVCAGALAIGICFIPFGGQASFAKMDALQYFVLLIVGILAAITLVVPGISGSMLLMILGFYQPIINLISDLMKFQNVGNNLLILIVFALGVVVGFIIVSKLINYCLKKFPTITYMAIIGFVISSLFSLFYISFTDSQYKIVLDALQISLAVVLAILGLLFSLYISYYQQINRYFHSKKGGIEKNGSDNI